MQLPPRPEHFLPGPQLSGLSQQVVPWMHIVPHSVSLSQQTLHPWPGPQSFLPGAHTQVLPSDGQTLPSGHVSEAQQVALLIHAFPHNF